MTFPPRGVAVVEIAVRLFDAKGLPPGIRADADGVPRTQLFEVFALRDGERVTVANHNTAVIA